MEYYIEILIATIVSMFLGMVWYSPVMFANAWMKEIGFSKKDVEKVRKEGMGGRLLANFVSTFIIAMNLFLILSVFGVIDNFISSLASTFFIWLAFVAMVSLNRVLWEGFSLRGYLINSCHVLVMMLLMAIVFYFV